MTRIKIVPLSVNRAWQGRRFKTPDYQSYEQELIYLLPKLKVEKDNKLRLEITWGLSNLLSDIDNCLKPFLDILQKKYDFNDRLIYELNVTKKKVNKGEEYIEFSIKSYSKI